MKVAGKLSSRVYLAPGASVENAKQQIVADIIRSLKTRLVNGITFKWIKDFKSSIDKVSKFFYITIEHVVCLQIIMLNFNSLITFNFLKKNFPIISW